MKLTSLLAGVALVASATVAAAEVKVGMITTLSGGGAGLGIDVRDGFMLAVEQSGRSDIEVVIEDDQRKPDIAVQLADKMIQSEKVDVLTGIIWSNLAMAVVPSVTAQGKFYLSPNAGPSALAGKGCHQNYFNVAWQNDNLHEAAGAYASGAGYKNSFILAPNYPAGQGRADRLQALLRGRDRGRDSTPKLGQTDYAAEIAQIRAIGAPTACSFFLPGGMGISFLKQYADSGVDLPVVGPAFSFDQGILQAVGDAAIGVVNTSQWNKDLDNPANAAFVESFEAEYGRLPSLYASQGFDTANLLIAATARQMSSPMRMRSAPRCKAADFASSSTRRFLVRPQPPPGAEHLCARGGSKKAMCSPTRMRRHSGARKTTLTPTLATARCNADAGGRSDRPAPAHALTQDRALPFCDEARLAPFVEESRSRDHADGLGRGRAGGGNRDRRGSWATGPGRSGF